VPEQTPPIANPVLRRAVAAVVPTLPLARLLADTLAAVPPIEKGDGSPVTAADYVLQAVVVSALRASSEDGRVPLVGEEHADALAEARRPDVERLVVDTLRAALGWRSRAEALRAIDGDEPRPGEPWWTIDPIDGTKGFILAAQCSVCLALVDGRSVEAAVLGCPRMGPSGDLGVHLGGPGMVYAASRGGGAFELDAAGGVVRRLSLERSSSGAVRWARSMNRSASPMPSRLEPRLAAVAHLEESRMDSQCKYALLARGDADLVVRLPRACGHRESVWDHASGTLIAAEAGATVTDAVGVPLDFSHGASLAANAGIACAAPGVDPRVLEAVADVAGGTAAQGLRA
jgi:3'(2'), 5'-bisphosphate nucleotidase